jgi:hypothetical protein
MELHADVEDMDEHDTCVYEHLAVIVLGQLAFFS